MFCYWEGRFFFPKKKNIEKGRQLPFQGPEPSTSFLAMLMACEGCTVYGKGCPRKLGSMGYFTYL